MIRSYSPASGPRSAAPTSRAAHDDRRRRANDLQQNWRLGGTLSFPVDRWNSVKLYASSGVSDRTGNDFDLVGIAWQHRWGGGL